MQLDWLELSETPWGVKAYVLVGALSHSGKLPWRVLRGETLRRIWPRRWTGCCAGWAAPRGRGGPTGWQRSSTRAPTGCGREAAAMAKHYGVEVAVCPREAPAAQGCRREGDQVRDAVVVALGAGRRRRRRRRPTWTAGASRCPIAAGAGRSTVGELGGQPSRCCRCRSCRSRPSTASERVVSRDALVAFETNRYSVPPGHAGRHGRGPGPARRAAPGDLHARRPPDRPASPRAGRRRADDPHSPSTRACSSGRCSSVHHRGPCRAKPNRPPGERALAEAAKLRGEHAPTGVVVDLEQYARIARVAGR